MNNWIIGFTILLLVTGLTAGIVAGGLNPWTDPVKAERIQAGTRYIEAMNGLEELFTRAQTEADIQTIQREQKMPDAQYEHDIQELNQDLLHQGFTFRLWIIILMIFGGIFSIVVIIGAILLESSKVLANISFDPA